MERGWGMPTTASGAEKAAFRQNSPTGELGTSDLIRSKWGTNGGDSSWNATSPMASPDARDAWAHAAKLRQSGEAQSRIAALTGGPPPAFPLATSKNYGVGFGIAGDEGFVAAQNFTPPSFPTYQSTAYQPNSKASNNQRPSMQDTIAAASQRYRNEMDKSKPVGKIIDASRKVIDKPPSLGPSWDKLRTALA